MIFPSNGPMGIIDPPCGGPMRMNDPPCGGPMRMNDPPCGGPMRMIDPPYGGSMRMIDPPCGGSMRMIDPPCGGSMRMIVPPCGRLVLSPLQVCLVVREFLLLLSHLPLKYLQTIAGLKIIQDPSRPGSDIDGKTLDTFIRKSGQTCRAALFCNFFLY
jgi:hypothetical protein